MTNKILKQLQSSTRQGKVIEQLSFPQAVELLKALSTPGMASGDKLMQLCIIDLLERFNAMHFDIITNELTYREFNQLYDAYVNLKYSSVKSLRALWKTSFKDESLRQAFEHRQFAEVHYPE